MEAPSRGHLYVEESTGKRRFIVFFFERFLREYNPTWYAARPHSGSHASDILESRPPVINLCCSEYWIAFLCFLVFLAVSLPHDGKDINKGELRAPYFAMILGSENELVCSLKAEVLPGRVGMIGITPLPLIRCE
jgi:hypothetical protein